MQLLTHYSLFTNLSCSPTNILMFESYRISLALKILSVSRTIALDILNVFWQYKAYYRPSSGNQSLYCLWWDVFLLLIHFLIVEEFELPKNTSHVLSVPLTLECVRILSWSLDLSLFSFALIASLLMFCVTSAINHLMS